MTYEEYLENNGSLTYTNVGVSMMPLLRQGKDLFTVAKKTERRCKKGDGVLYRRPPDKYVLHRVIAVRQNDYVILGDNCISKEYGIKDSDIIGVMTGYVRNGKDHTTDHWAYRLYSAVWVNFYPLRILIMKVSLKLYRFIKPKRR